MASGFEIRKADCRAGLSAHTHTRARAWFALATGAVNTGSAASPAPHAPLLHASSTPKVVTASSPHVDAGTEGHGVSHMLTHTHTHYYMSVLIEVFGNVDPVPPKLFRIPFLGVEPSVLPEEAAVLLSQPTIAMSAAHDRIVCVCAHMMGLKYAPQVANLALVLLRFLSEPEVFTMLNALLRHNTAARMLLLSRKEEAAFVKTFRTLIKGYFPRLSAHVEALGPPVRAIFASWFRGFFSGYLLPEDTYKVVDAYLYEGPKVLLRYGLALLKCLKRKLKTCATATEFDLVCRRYVGRHVLVTSPVASAYPKLSSTAPPDVGVAALAGALHLSEKAVRDILAAGHDPAIPHPYTFEFLQSTAFTGIANLSRSTIDKLMARYLGGSSAGSGGGIPGLGSPGTAPDDAIPGNTSSHVAHVRTRSDSGAPGAERGAGLTGRSDSSEAPVMTHVVLASQNAVLTVPSAMESAALMEVRRRERADSGMPARPAGAPDDDASIALWRCPKIMGIGSRLMSVDFAPQESHLLSRRITHALSAATSSMYSPALESASGAPSIPPLRMRSSAISEWVSRIAGDSDTATSPSGEQGGARSDAIRAAALAVAASPHLASLSTLLPDRVAMQHWTCVYSTDAHGWSLHTLYQRCAGFAPCFLVMQAGLRDVHREAGVAAPAASVDAHGSIVSKLTTAVSSKRPVFGFFSRNGLPMAGHAGGGMWTGHSEDFLFQLYPELNCFAVSNMDGGSAFTGLDLLGDGHRTKLQRGRFLSCTPDALLIGGHATRSGEQELLLPSDLHVARASRDLLLDMAVPGVQAAEPGMADSALELDILAVEVYAFVDHLGSCMTNVNPAAMAAAPSATTGPGSTPPAGVSAADLSHAVAHLRARRLYASTLQKWWAAAATKGAA